MSIFGKIMSSIFGKANAAGAAPAAPASGAKPSSSTAAAAPAGSITEVDVAGVLTKLAGGEEGEARLANVDRRSDETARSRQQPIGAQGACAGAALLRRHERLGVDECVAAQAGHAEARRKRRQGAGGTEGLSLLCTDRLERWQQHAAGCGCGRFAHANASKAPGMTGVELVGGGRERSVHPESA